MLAEDPVYLEGGIPRYAVPVAEEFAQRGNDVDYLYSGGYTGHYDWLFQRRWKAYEREDVRYHRLVNAKSIGVHKGRPLLDVVCDDSDWIARRARSLRPDVIHIHSLVGVPFETISKLAQVAPLIFSFHDFGLICQRRVLYNRNGQPSQTYAQQSECASCVERVNPPLYRLRARLRRTPKGSALRLIHAFERATEIEVTVSVNGNRALVADESAAEPFRARLAAGIGAVNAHAGKVLAVSHSVREVLSRVGIDESLIEVMHIGSSSAERLERLPLPSARSQRVTFLFLGALVGNKGPHILLEAASRIDPPPRIILTGNAYNPTFEARLRDLAPSSAEFVGPYQPVELPRVLGAADVVVAPAMAPDTSPQVVLEALAAGRPVIGSRIGGIPDFVKDGVNGRLFEPGDVATLARLLEELADPEEVARLARNAKHQKPVADHIDELEEVYAGLR